MVSEDGFAEAAANSANNVLTGIDGGVKTWIIVGILGLFVVQFLIVHHSGSKRTLKLPPGPRNLPIIGALFSIEANLPHWFGKLHKQFGPILYYRLGSNNVIVVSSVEGVEEVLRTKDSQFADRPHTALLKTGAKYIGFEAQNIVLGSYTDNVKTLKKACMTEFFTAAKLATYENVRRREGASMVEEISGRTAGGSIDLKVRESINIISSNVICLLLFGKRYSDAILSEAGGFKHYPYMVVRAGQLALRANLVDLFPWLDWTSIFGTEVAYKEFQQLVKNCFGETLEEHRRVRKSVEKYQDKDFVDLLLTLEENEKINENGIFGCLLDMISAGIDTISNSVEWALLMLIKKPETLAKLRAEINKVVGDDRPVEESDFANMPYLQAVMKETLRLHNSAPLLIPHFTKSESSLGGFYVPPKTTVFLNMYALARDPLLWENPEEFIPERFMGSRHSNITNMTGSAYELLPFGRGRRMCPGWGLGLLMAQRTLTTLVHAFDWSPPPGVGVDDISAAEEMKMTCRPEVSLVLRATPRLAPTVYNSLVFQTTS